MRLITDIQFHPNYILVVCKGRSIQDDDMNSIAHTLAQSQPGPGIVLIDVSHIGSFKNTDLARLWVRYMELCAAGWKLAFVRVPENLQLLFANSGLEQVIPAFLTEEHAIESLTNQVAKGVSAA